MSASLQKTCKHGHSLEDAYEYKDDFGKKVRKCAECHRARVKRSRSRKKVVTGIVQPDGRIVTFDAGGNITLSTGE
jgi:hypothetical protein